MSTRRKASTNQNDAMLFEKARRLTDPKTLPEEFAGMSLAEVSSRGGVITGMDVPDWGCADSRSLAASENGGPEGRYAMELGIGASLYPINSEVNHACRNHHNCER